MILVVLRSRLKVLATPPRPRVDAPRHVPPLVTPRPRPVHPPLKYPEGAEEAEGDVVVEADGSTPSESA